MLSPLLACLRINAPPPQLKPPISAPAPEGTCYLGHARSPSRMAQFSSAEQLQTRCGSPDAYVEGGVQGGAVLIVLDDVLLASIGIVEGAGRDAGVVDGLIIAAEAVVQADLCEISMVSPSSRTTDYCSLKNNRTASRFKKKRRRHASAYNDNAEAWHPIPRFVETCHRPGVPFGVPSMPNLGVASGIDCGRSEADTTSRF